MIRTVGCLEEKVTCCTCLFDIAYTIVSASFGTSRVIQMMESEDVVIYAGV